MIGFITLFAAVLIGGSAIASLDALNLTVTQTEAAPIFARGAQIWALLGAFTAALGLITGAVLWATKRSGL